ncbi:MAG: hypothetical protein AAB686_02530 [Patescibacteria group bacterium]|mgnify:FL=1
MRIACWYCGLTFEGRSSKLPKHTTPKDPEDPEGSGKKCEGSGSGGIVLDEIDAQSVSTDQLGHVTFLSPLPLANPETLFSYGAWGSTLDFISTYLPIHGVKKVSDQACITFRDLYFARDYPSFNFARAKTLFEAAGAKVEERLDEPNDRDAELHLRCTFGSFDFSLYEFKGDVCVSVGGAVRTDSSVVKRGRFPHPPVIWQTTHQEFMKFVGAVEASLLGHGFPEECRVFLAFKMRHVRVEVACCYHPIFPEPQAQIWRGLVWNERRVVPPRFSITFL